MSFTDINNLTITNGVDPVTGDPVLNFSVAMSANFSGATSLSLLYWLRNNNQTWITLSRSNTTDSFSSTIQLSPYATSGEYEIRRIDVYDNSSNLVEFSTDQLKNEFGFNTSTFLQNQNSDSIAPSVISLEVGLPTFSSDAILIPMTVKASDDSSGLNSAFIIELTSPSGTSIQQWCYFDENGEFSGDFSLSKDSASGNYSFNTIRLFDEAGNSNLSQTWLAANSNPIEIDNSNSDATPPTLESFQLSAEFDPVSGRPRIVMSGSSEDPASGVSGIYLRMQAPATSTGVLDTWVYHSYSGSPSVDFLNYKSLTSEFRPGVYTVDYLRLNDIAGNQVYFNSAQLSQLGFDHSINVFYQEIVNNTPIVGSDQSDYIFGSNASDDSLIGGMGNDYLFSGDGTDTLYSGQGDDFVDGGNGNDLIIGGNGAGNDTYVGGAGFDTVKYTSATAGIVVNLAAGTATSRFGGDAAGIGSDTLNGIENIIAGDYDDILYGNDSNNNIDGGAGNDLFYADRGDDIIDGGSGIDIVEYASNRRNFTVEQIGSQFIITNANFGTDTLTSIEFLKFNGDIISITDALKNTTDTSNPTTPTTTPIKPPNLIDSIIINPDGSQKNTDSTASTADFLSNNFGISIDSARAWVLERINKPREIYDICVSNGITSNMLAAIVQESFPSITMTGDVVNTWLISQGVPVLTNASNIDTNTNSTVATATYLNNNFGISIDSARAWVMDRINAPREIYDICAGNGITSHMLAAVVQESFPLITITGGVVNEWFVSQGIPALA
jgi:hypothetical protein